MTRPMVDLAFETCGVTWTGCYCGLPPDHASFYHQCILCRSIWPDTASDPPGGPRD